MYFCFNAPHYHRWADEFPPLQAAVVDAAGAAGARLVVLKNLYMYGPTGGAPMTESPNPPSVAPEYATTEHEPSVLRMRPNEVPRAYLDPVTRSVGATKCRDV